MERRATIKKCKQKDFDPDRPKSEQRWCLYTKDGSKLLGRHPTKEDARDQEVAIHARGGRYQMRKANASPKLVKKWMRSEVLRDPLDWVDTHDDLLYIELAEAAANYFDSPEWLDDDLHPVWDWSVEVLEQLFESDPEQFKMPNYPPPRYSNSSPRRRRTRAAAYPVEVQIVVGDANLAVAQVFLKHGVGTDDKKGLDRIQQAIADYVRRNLP
jgi:hypothetical protein